MIQIAIDAHRIDEDFEQELAARRVRIIDRSDEPWCVIFEGSREALINLLHANWGCLDVIEAADLVDSSIFKGKP